MAVTVSKKALRDLARRILREALGSRIDPETGLYLPASVREGEIEAFVEQMSDEQLRQMYFMMHECGFVQ